MARTTYLPTRQNDLLSFTSHFSASITPSPTEYGLTLAQSGPYAGIQQAYAYADAMAVATNRVTRSPANIEKKNTARDALIAETRKLVDIIQAWPGMTNDKRAALGITLRNNVSTRAPIPTSAPKVRVASVEGRLLNLRLREMDANGRSKPMGVRSAWLYSYVGDEQPMDFAQMTFRGAATRADTQIVMPQSVAVNSKVWVSACWVNTADKPGPVSVPVFTWTNHGAMQNNAA